MCRSNRLLAGGLVLLSGYLAWGQVEGQPAPDYKLKPERGEEYWLFGDLYKDHIVVLYYWNSMDSTSVELLPLLKELHSKYRNRGVVIIALTREKKERALRAVESKGAWFDWIAWGINPEEPYRFPAPRTTYIIDVYGRVAQARFDAGDNLEERILAQLRKTPTPAATDERLSQQLAAVRALMSAQDYGRAYTVAERLRHFFWTMSLDLYERRDRERRSGSRRGGGDEEGGGSGNPQLDQAEELLKQVFEGGKQWLTQAREEIKKEDYESACRKLANLSVRLEKKAKEEGGERRDRSARRSRGEDRRRGRDRDRQGEGEGEVVEEIRDFEELKEHVDREVGRLQGDAYTKAIINKALDNVRGEVQNELAAELLANGMYLEALDAYRETSEKYPGTEAARAAAAAMDKIYKDPQLREQIKKTEAAEQAARWFDLGERFARCELFDQAREYFEKVIKNYPDSAVAEKAKSRLAGLADEQKKAEARRRAREAGGAPSGGG